MRHSLLVFLALSYCFLHSCTTLYGIKKVKERHNSEIIDFANKVGIPGDDLYFIGQDYLEYIAGQDTNQKTAIKNHMQPLQVYYFDQSGTMTSYHVNCDMGGFPNLKWNQNGAFDAFVPPTQTTLDDFVDFDKLLSFLETSEGKAVNTSKFNNADFNVVVFWSVTMGRQSRRLVKQVKENVALANDKPVNLLFVNNDAHFDDESGQL